MFERISEFFRGETLLPPRRSSARAGPGDCEISSIHVENMQREHIMWKGDFLAGIRRSLTGSARFARGELRCLCLREKYESPAASRYGEFSGNTSTNRLLTVRQTKSERCTCEDW